MSARDQLIAALDSIICASIKRDRPDAAERVVEAMEKHFSVAVKTSRQWAYGRIGPMKLWAETTPVPFEPTFNNTEQPEKVNDAGKLMADMLQCYREHDDKSIRDAYAPDCEMVKGYKVKDPAPTTVRLQDPDVRELLRALGCTFSTSLRPYGDCWGNGDKFQAVLDAFKKVRAKYD